ncbi:MAG: tripartite tricarboxylate transporter substrate-binding protein [Beijerinckiaceae bacterium]|nr:tripartite tricarboxylate transporter substrate-binding protein [Beijerinckiaceae bacterium]
MVIITSSGPGGGYDAYSRMFARHMSKHLPGNPNIIVNNMPGAAGIRAANYLYNVAPKDGSTIALIDRGIQTAPLLYGAESKAQFEAVNFHQIGSVMQETGMVVLSSKSPVNNLDDMRKMEIIVGSQGPEQDPAMYPRLLNQLAGSKFKIVYGYKGQPEVFNAVEKDELNGLFMSGWSGNGRAYVLDKMNKGEMKLLMQLATQRDPNHQDVPTILEAVTAPADKQIVEVLLSRLALGRPFIAPPGVPADRVRILRTAFRKSVEDPELIADAQKGRLAIDPIWGEQAQEIIATAYKTDPAVINRIRKIIKLTD